MEIKFIEPVRQYESTYVLTPDLSEADTKALVDKFTKILSAEGVKVTNQEIWGLKKLAYPIQKKMSGYYVFVEFSAPTSFLKKLETEYKYDEKVLRALTVKLDKESAAYNDKRRAKLNIKTN